MPRTTMRRAGTVALTSFATLTLLPLLAPAKPSERVLLLLAAVPAAVLLGYLAGHTAATGPHSHDERLQEIQQEIQQHIDQLQAAQRSAAVTAQPAAPVVTVVSEPVPGPGTGSPIGGGHLAALARPPADQLRPGLHLVDASSRGAVTTPDAPADAAPGGLDESSPHLTLIVTHPDRHLTS